MGTLSIPCASRRQRHRGEGERASVPCGTLAFFLLSGFTRLCAGSERFCIGAKFSFDVKREPENHQRFRRAGSDGLRYPASTSCLGRHSCPADRGPNSSSLYPPQAAVVAVARKGLLAPFRPRRSCRSPKMLAASLNAFFCASPIYGSAEDFTFLLNFTPCEGVTPAAKQQIGETRKKR